MTTPCEWQTIFGTRIKIRLHAKIAGGILAILLAETAFKTSQNFHFSLLRFWTGRDSLLCTYRKLLAVLLAAWLTPLSTY